MSDINDTDKGPAWYTPAELRRYLKKQNYSDAIADELGKLYADNLELAYRKGIDTTLHSTKQRHPVNHGFHPDEHTDGISILQYFAAHAPNAPKWFKPEIEDEPKKPPLLKDVFGKGSDHPDKEIYVKFYDEENDTWIDFLDETVDKNVSEKLKKEVASLNDQWMEYFKIQKSWVHQRNVQTLIQWRYFYAEEMLYGPIHLSQLLVEKAKEEIKKIRTTDEHENS